jgi:hypothetical protein
MSVVLGASLARGDVVTTVSGSELFVTGDGDPNEVVIEDAAGAVAVSGRGGTLVDGSTDGVTVAGIRRVTVKLRNGRDRLTLTGLTLPDGIVLRLGGGDDDVVLDQVDAGATRIKTGNGYDVVQVFGPTRLNHLAVTMSNGRDFLGVDGAWIRGDLHVDTGADDDDVTIVATEVGDDVDVHGGNDDDVIVLADVSFDDDTHVDGENGDDVLVFSGYLWFGDELDLDGFDDDWW